MDGYICTDICESSSLEANVLKINFGCPPSHGLVFTNSSTSAEGSIPVPTQANSTGEQNHHHANPAGLHGKPGVQRPHKIHSGLGEITTKKLPLITNDQV